MDSLLSKLDHNVYDTESTTSNLYILLRTINNELCEAYAQIVAAKNDNYLWVDVVDEPVVRGEPHAIDCLANWAVVEIIRVGDTPGASDYLQYVDFLRTWRGIHWVGAHYYGYYPAYGYGYGGYGWGWNSYTNYYWPLGRKEPVTGSLYYVTYRFGVRDENLYDNFGILTKLQKRDYWTWEEYRKAVKSLTLAFLAGPTISNMRIALSAFHPESLIEITEGKTGWVLGRSILYSEADWKNPAIDTSDGTLLLDPNYGQYRFTVIFHQAQTIPESTRNVLMDIVEIMKPAHTIAIVVFYDYA
jgi:hypothetical protein